MKLTRFRALSIKKDLLNALRQLLNGIKRHLARSEGKGVLGWGSCVFDASLYLPHAKLKRGVQRIQAGDFQQERLSV